MTVFTVNWDAPAIPPPQTGGTKSGWSDRCSSNLPNGVARIDQDRCKECEACVEACPNEAILAMIEPVEEKAISLHEQPAPEVTLAEPHRTNVVPVVGAAPAYLGREVAPRLVTYLAVFRPQCDQPVVAAFRRRGLLWAGGTLRRPVPWGKSVAVTTEKWGLGFDLLSG